MPSAVRPSIPAWIRLIAAIIRSAAGMLPYVVVARKALVRCSRPHGSPRKPECWLTAAMARGCSDCSSRARMPPTNIDASACTRQIGSSGVNQRGPGASKMRVWADSKSDPAIRLRTRAAVPLRRRAMSVTRTVRCERSLRTHGNDPRGADGGVGHAVEHEQGAVDLSIAVGRSRSALRPRSRSRLGVAAAATTAGRSARLVGVEDRRRRPDASPGSPCPTSGSVPARGVGHVPVAASVRVHAPPELDRHRCGVPSVTITRARPTRETLPAATSRAAGRALRHDPGHSRD